MGGLLRILIIALFVWYGIKLLFRYLLPYFLGRYITKQEQKNVKREGDVTIHIDEKLPKESENKEKKGEYIDYEEVD